MMTGQSANKAQTRWVIETDGDPSAVVSSASAFIEDARSGIDALLAVQRARLEQELGSDREGPDSLTICLRVALEPETGDAPESRDWHCWTHRYPCGKSSTGYIMCSVRVCENTGPVTLPRSL